MAVQKYTPEQLSDIIEVTATIECSKCEKIDGTWNEDNAEIEFFKKGWRATRNNVYCPKCAKKNLKS